MGRYGSLIVGCVIFIPIIALLLVTAWKNWRGKWLAFSDLTYLADERPENLQRRKGRRAALVYLVWVVALAGALGITAFSALSGFAVNLDMVSAILAACVFVGGSWLVATSRREFKIASSAVGESSELAGEYVLDARRAAMLAIAMLAVLAAEIICTLIV
ncbi:hypothetical protein [Arabiibacter massiliensis]|uniref:hypothetical protein n=1 Tax=Arabiibacter massiliensis TaxID=1870985 RepID=UPI0009BAE2EC|nr:hypothetical protein [Arabiibacter massiliensis]